MLLCWFWRRTNFLSTDSLSSTISSSPSVLFFICVMVLLLLFLSQGFEFIYKITKTQKGHTLNVKTTWCVLCANLEIWQVIANFQLTASVNSPCLSFFPQLCYISLPLSLFAIVSFSASIFYTPLSSQYFTIWKVTQSFPSRGFADRKFIFNEVTLLLKCF